MARWILESKQNNGFRGSEGLAFLRAKSHAPWLDRTIRLSPRGVPIGVQQTAEPFHCNRTTEDPWPIRSRYHGSPFVRPRHLVVSYTALHSSLGLGLGCFVSCQELMCPFSRQRCTRWPPDRRHESRCMERCRAELPTSARCGEGGSDPCWARPGSLPRGLSDQAMWSAHIRQWSPKKAINETSSDKTGMWRVFRRVFQRAARGWLVLGGCEEARRLWLLVETSAIVCWLQCNNAGPHRLGERG
jgi:hypothetical protein